jgi:glycosyltransferase involved in cell wall biosynthesis
VTAGRVAVNLLWCVPGQVGGSEEYLDRQLQGLGDEFDVELYVPQHWSTGHQELATRWGVHISGVDVSSRARRMWAENTWLHRRTADADLVHHGGGTAPARSRRPYVLTVHDLQYRTYPQYFSARKRRYLDVVLPRSIERAAVVAVPSDYVRDTVLAACDVSPDRVMVVPHGFVAPEAQLVAGEQDVRRRFDLGDGPVLVYPAVTHPHKNHRFLIDLMASAWTDPDLRLVFIGGVGRAEAEIATADPRVRRLGRVSDTDRNGLLAMAEAMVFPTQYEGFGAPLVEAMALGAPVVASDVTCVPSIVADGGIVLPLVAEAWAGVLDDVRSRRTALRAAGVRRAAAFSVEASGAALTATYRRGLAVDR